VLDCTIVQFLLTLENTRGASHLTNHNFHSTSGRNAPLCPFIFRIPVFNSHLLYEEVINIYYG